MPTITACEAKRNVYHVTTDDGQTTELPGETVLRHGLTANTQLSLREWREIQREGEIQLAYEKTLVLLGNRPHTRSELSRKLYERGFGKNSREAALDRAARYGLVDDAAFARIYIEEKLRVAGWGRRRLVAELRKRGVAANTIDDVLAEFQPEFHDDSLLERALQVARTRRHSWQKETDLRKRRDKLFRLLGARGFDFPICNRVWDAVGQQDFTR